MQITKILSLSEDEMSKLTEAGKILGSVRDTEFDSLSEKTLEFRGASCKNGSLTTEYRSGYFKNKDR